MTFEIQAHRANDEATLRRYLEAEPTSIELDVVLGPGGLVVAHELDLSDASGLTLVLALELAGETPLVVEAKSCGNGAELVEALEPYLGRVRVISFDEEVVRRVYGRSPTTFLVDEGTCQMPQLADRFFDTLGPHHSLVTRELVDAAHAAGKRVVPWTVNDPARMAELIALGVDGLTTDRPELARTLRRSGPEPPRTRAGR
jgi:glycerophosphoryl diester phosphodiesterase